MYQVLRLWSCYALCFAPVATALCQQQDVLVLSEVLGRLGKGMHAEQRSLSYDGGKPCAEEVIRFDGSRGQISFDLHAILSGTPVGPIGQRSLSVSKDGLTGDSTIRARAVTAAEELFIHSLVAPARKNAERILRESHGSNPEILVQLMEFLRATQENRLVDSNGGSFTSLSGVKHEFVADNEGRIVELTLSINGEIVRKTTNAFKLAEVDLGSNQPGSGVDEKSRAQKSYGFLLNPTARPLEVKAVLPGSIAERAGLKQGDVIIEVEGIELDHLDAPMIVDHLVRSAKVEISISRGGEVKKIDLVK